MGGLESKLPNMGYLEFPDSDERWTSAVHLGGVGDRWVKEMPLFSGKN